MSFNVDKCKIMHLGYGNAKYEYELNNTTLSKSTGEKDLGVLIDNDLKFFPPHKKHCCKSQQNDWTNQNKFWK